MRNEHADAAVERFQPTNGRIIGYVGLACAAVILALAIAGWSSDRAPGVAIFALLCALLAWVVMLRPAMWATDRDLVMRSMFHTDTIPLAAVDKVAVAQFTSVFVGEKRYVSPVVGYSARQAIKQRAGARSPDGRAASPADTYQVFVEERIIHLVKEAQERSSERSPGVRRTYAWPEITGAVVLVVAFLVWLLVI